MFFFVDLFDIDLFILSFSLCKQNREQYLMTRNKTQLTYVHNKKYESCKLHTKHNLLVLLIIFSFCLTHHIKDMTKHKKKTSSRVNIIKGKHRPYAWKCWLCITLVMDTQSEKNEFHLKYKMITNHIERWILGNLAITSKFTMIRYWL